MSKYSFPIEIIRTDRAKSASIQLDGIGVKVRVPRNLSDARVDALISKKSTWIKKSIEVARKLPKSRKKEYVNGECFAYLGKNYRLKVTEGPSSAKLKGGYFEVFSPTPKKTEAIRGLLTQWYKRNALARLKDKTIRFSDILGVKPASVSIKDYRSRWGSCSAGGELSYNWKIIIAPHTIVDYVVVHELSHLIEHNHSAKFWSHVKSILKDHQGSRDWLKLNAETLEV